MPDQDALSGEDVEHASRLINTIDLKYGQRHVLAGLLRWWLKQNPQLERSSRRAAQDLGFALTDSQVHAYFGE